MKIQFVYGHRGDKKSAKMVLEEMNKHYPEYQWKSFSRRDPGSPVRWIKETLQIEVATLRSYYIEACESIIRIEVGKPIQILIDGRTPLEYCAWAQYWLRKKDRESERANRHLSFPD